MTDDPHPPQPQHAGAPDALAAGGALAPGALSHQGAMPGPQGAPGASGARPIGTLMIIDDNSFDQMMYKRIVTKSGHAEQIVQFTDPEAALAALVAQSCPRPDLIILDINMPRMNGFEFLEAAEAQIGTQLCPVIVMLTTSLLPQDELRARRSPLVKEFMNKPLTGDMLGALREMIHRLTPPG